MLDELEALCVLHCRPILDRLNVLLVVERYSGRVEVQDVTEFVADIGSHPVVSAVFKPELNEVLPSAETETCTDHSWLIELLTYLNF